MSVASRSRTLCARCSPGLARTAWLSTRSSRVPRPAPPRPAPPRPRYPAPPRPARRWSLWYGTRMWTSELYGANLSSMRFNDDAGGRFMETCKDIEHFVGNRGRTSSTECVPPREASFVREVWPSRPCSAFPSAVCVKPPQVAVRRCVCHSVVLRGTQLASRTQLQAAAVTWCRGAPLRLPVAEHCVFSRGEG